MSAFTEKIYGKEFTDKIAAFDKAILEVEARNIEWFKKRKPRFKPQEHDSITNHIVFAYSPQGPISFGFDDGSELPERQKKECLEIFKRHFGSK